MRSSNFGKAMVAVALGGLLPAVSVEADRVIHIAPSADDMTPVVRNAIEEVRDTHIKLVFAEGTYHFKPDYAFQKYCAVTNHENGLKNIIFNLSGFESVEIEGNGAELIFSGQVMPFLFEDCSKVTARDFSIDWDIPFLFQGEVIAVNPEEGWRDLKPSTEGFSWKLVNGQVQFPLIDEFMYSSLGSSLAFEKDPKRVAHGAWDLNSRPKFVERRKGGVLRFHEQLRQFPEVGTILNSKGPKGENRYAPAIHVKSSSNIHMENVVVHHALGMGFLMERTDTATLKNCGVYVKEGSDRVVSATADATHFCNCKGEILMEGCRFEQMLDDGTNVHGTYVEVNRVINDHTIRVELKHFQQLGFEFAGPGDEVWLIHQPSPRRTTVNMILSARKLNDRFIELKFRDTLPRRLRAGDLIENKTWNPTFTLRGCTIQNHRARNIVLKTPLKILIEDNDFSSMMSSIFFRGESFYWFESGNVQDVTIRNNRFNYCAYSGAEHAVLNITPRLGQAFRQDEMFDRNIRFENNIIETFDSRIVWADRVDGLVIANNTIKQVKNAEPLYPDAAMFDFRNCRNVELRNNSYEGDQRTMLAVDNVSESTLLLDHNNGIE
ncbi:MAG: right-handed parallel beta-helix repeat-containing protein [Puniceicoccaceae bacterium]